MAYLLRHQILITINNHHQLLSLPNSHPGVYFDFHKTDSTLISLDTNDYLLQILL